MHADSVPNDSVDLEAVNNTTALRVLVVDDNPDCAEILALALRDEGHDARAVCTGRSALEVAFAFRPQVFLLDIAMPGMSGLEVARALRERGETRESMLIAMSGFGQAKDEAQARAAGFQHYLTKPLNLAAISRLLTDSARLRADNRREPASQRPVKRHLTTSAPLGSYVAD